MFYLCSIRNLNKINRNTMGWIKKSHWKDTIFNCNWITMKIWFYRYRERKRTLSSLDKVLKKLWYQELFRPLDGGLYSLSLMGWIYRKVQYSTVTINNKDLILYISREKENLHLFRQILKKASISKIILTFSHSFSIISQ